MNPTPVRFRPLPALARWYLFDRPLGFVAGGARYAVALFESFSVVFLLKTLLSPWKNILDDGRTRSIQALLEAWSLNLLSRGVGCVVRIAAVFAAIVLTASVLAVGIALAIAWYALPFTVVALPLLAWLFKREVVDRFVGAGTPLELLSVGCVPRGVDRTILSARDVLSCVLRSPQAAFVLEELMIDRGAAASAFDASTDDMDRDQILARADEVRVRFSDDRILPVHVLVALLATEQGNALLRSADADPEDLWHVALRERMYERWKTRPGAWSPEGIARSDMFGQSWARGYTDELDALTVDVRPDPWDPGDATMLHKDAVLGAMRALRESNKNNVLVAAPRGSGRTMFVRHVAAAIHDTERRRHERYTRFLRLRTDVLLSGTANPDAFLLQALARAKRERLAIVIPDAALLLKATDPKLRLVLQRCLESANITVLAVVDPAELHSVIEKDAALHAAFETVLLESTGDADLMQVLAIESFRWEDAGVVTSYKALKAVVSLCRRFLPQAGYPGVCIDVLDDAAHAALRRNSRTVSEDDVRSVVTAKSRVDVSTFTAAAAPKLLALEEAMERRIIGQRQGIRVLCDALKRASADVRARPRPLGTFLFLGPTGVGKTRTAQVLAEEYFGSADALVRLDLNECGTEESVANVIGTADGSATLALRVRERPFCVVLLDEIEKAHPKVLNLFLQVLDEGRLQGADGSLTDFRNAIIVATSNAGALFVRDRIAEGEIPSAGSGQAADERAFTRELVDHVLREKLFTPEFVNRFDATVVFRPLTGDDAFAIAKLMVDEVAASVREGKGIEVEVTDAAVKALLDRGYSPEFGARELRRMVSDVIENHLADLFLRQPPARGDRIEIDAGDLKP